MGHYPAKASQSFLFLKSLKRDEIMCGRKSGMSPAAGYHAPTTTSKNILLAI